MCSNWESPWQPFGSQAGTQSTEPHQPGQNTTFVTRFLLRQNEKMFIKHLGMVAASIEIIMLHIIISLNNNNSNKGDQNF